MTYSISWQLRDIIKWTLHHICISINNYNFIQRHLTHFLKKKEWKHDFKTRNRSTPISIQSQRKTLCALRPSWANWMRRHTVDCSSVDQWWWIEVFGKMWKWKKKLHSSSVQDKIRVVYPPALMMNALLLGKALVHWKKRYKVIIDLLIPVQPCTRITCK